jgi:hypothetical protein
MSLQFSSQKNNNVNLMLSIVFVFFLNAVASITGGCVCEPALCLNRIKEKGLK